MASLSKQLKSRRLQENKANAKRKREAAAFTAWRAKQEQP
jgi:hypothetical protein